MSLQPFVETLVKWTVADADAVSVSEKNDRGTIVYTVKVAGNDVGRVIGKDGRVVSCIRSLVGAAASKYRQRTVVKIVTED